MIIEGKPQKKEIQVGDVVHLNSGSPDMTVIALDCLAENVAVEWLSEDGIERHVYPSVCLQRTELA
jgi:uncharacterized protein YodC (DUF2158 family)